MCCSFQFLNVIALGVLAVIIRNPAMVRELENGYDDYSRMNEDAPALPTPLSKIDPYAYRDPIAYRKLNSLNLHFALFFFLSQTCSIVFVQCFRQC